jgi:hypothetical protein
MTDTPTVNGQAPADPDPDREAAYQTAVHMISHALAQIAADLHAIRAAVEHAAPVASAYQRGGILAARTAAREQRKQGGTPR